LDHRRAHWLHRSACITRRLRHAHVQSSLQGSAFNVYKTPARGFRQLWIVQNDFLGLGVARMQPLRDPVIFVRLLGRTEKFLDQHFIRLRCHTGMLLTNRHVGRQIHQTNRTTCTTSKEQRVVVIPTKSTTRFTKDVHDQRYAIRSPHAH
jgi:hypothetical protein